MKFHLEVRENKDLIVFPTQVHRVGAKSIHVRNPCSRETLEARVLVPGQATPLGAIRPMGKAALSRVLLATELPP